MKNITVWAIAIVSLGAFISPAAAQWGKSNPYAPAPVANKNCGCSDNSGHDHRSGLFGGFFHRLKTRWFGHDTQQPVATYNNTTVSTVPGQPIIINEGGSVPTGPILYPPYSETTAPPLETVPVINNP